MTAWEKATLFVTTGLTAAVMLKLWLTGLAKVYRLFLGYLSIGFLDCLAALTIPSNTNMYAYAYFAAQTLRIVVASFVLVEIYSLALERQPALSKFGRSAIVYILALAASIPLFQLFADHATIRGAYPVLRTFLLFEQTVDGTVAIFLVLVSLFLVWFPVGLRRNVALYIGGFILWFLFHSASIHVVNKWFEKEHVKHAADTIGMIGSVACLLIWLIGLKRAGEYRTAVVGHLWKREDTEMLIHQLDGFNRSLEGLRRQVYSSRR